MERRVAQLVIIVGLIAALFSVTQRVAAENAGRTVEIVLDLADARVVASAQGIPLEDYLVQMRQAGVHSVGVHEATLEQLAADGYIQLLQGGALRGVLDLGGSLQPQLAAVVQSDESDAFRPDAHYAIARDAAFGEWLADQLQRKLPGGARLLTAPGTAPTVIQVNVTEEQIEKMGVGLLADDVELVRRAGLYVVPRLENVIDASDDYIARTLDLVGDDLRTLMFNGNEVLGYPDRLEEMAAEMERRGLVQGLIEAPVQLSFVEQKGQQQLAELHAYRAVRVYGISRPELDKYTIADALDRQLRAVKERNIRVVYLRPVFVKVDQAQRAELNVQYARDLAQGLVDAGFQLGRAEPFGTLLPNRPLFALIAAGIVAAGVLLLRDLLPLPATLFYALLVLGVVGSGGLLLFSGGATVRKVLALGAAVAFPVHAALWAARVALQGAGRKALGAVLVRAGWALAGATGISLLAGLFIGALLGADSRYMLEIEYFRGVKISALLPIVLFGWAFIYRFGVRPEDKAQAPGAHDLFGQLYWFARQPVAAWHIALLGLAAVALYIYIGRTGHTAGISVSAAEIGARDLLEKLLVVRPRTKEFLLGHPALMLAIWAGARGYRQWVGLFLLGGTIALSSVVNSFAHLRTEFLVSLWRTGNGALLGYVVGAVAIVALHWLWPWLSQRWLAQGDDNTADGREPGIANDRI